MILMRTFLTLIFMLGISQGLAQQLESIYTDLKGKACKLVWQHEITGDTESECPGVGGNKLIVEDHDVRMSVTVIDPQGEKHRLNYYHTISRGTFSELGSKAEWMVQKKGNQTVPVALMHTMSQVMKKSSIPTWPLPRSLQKKSVSRIRFRQNLMPMNWPDKQEPPLKTNRAFPAILPRRRKWRTLAKQTAKKNTSSAKRKKRNLKKTALAKKIATFASKFASVYNGL